MLAVANCYLMAIPRSEFQPGFSAGLFFFINPNHNMRDTGLHHVIFRASAFIYYNRATAEGVQARQHDTARPIVSTSSSMRAPFIRKSISALA
jgi:hypothetical protein